MAINDKATVLGLTGPFGSGSTTAAQILCERLGFKPHRLSSFLNSNWEAEHAGQLAKRSDLQSLGDSLRKDRGPWILAEEAIRDLTAASEPYSRIVLDGIRNTSEIDFLRERYGGRFFLFALECPLSDRWERLRPTYEREGRRLEDFLREDERDKNEESDYGQQVELCVDQADILLDNSNGVPLFDLRKKLCGFAKLVAKEEYRHAKPIELFMNLAYSAALGSKCLKRQVGAVIVTAPPNVMGEVVGHGFNENPVGTRPCVEEAAHGADLGKKIPGRCYRDIVRQKSFVELAVASARCPSCGEVLKTPAQDGPPWRCANCSTDLEQFFWRERAMTLCTAVHAEVTAILSAGWRTRGATLYTTTFPCFQCAEKLAQAGIANVVFTEPYPDIRAAERLQIAGIKVLRFEGVRSRRFDEIFSKARKLAQLRVAGS